MAPKLYSNSKKYNVRYRVKTNKIGTVVPGEILADPRTEKKVSKKKN